MVALETAKMFENIEGAVMTPEQYIAFVRNAWALIGVSPGGPPPRPSGEEVMRKRLASALVPVVLALGLGGCGTTTSTEVGVRTSLFGIIEKRGEQQVYEPGGVYFFLPLINTWNTLPISQQNLLMNATPARATARCPTTSPSRRRTATTSTST